MYIRNYYFFVDGYVYMDMDVIIVFIKNFLIKIYYSCGLCILCIVDYFILFICK